MANLATLEILMTAYDAHLRRGEFLTSVDPRAWIRSSNVLLDVCLDAGMSYDEPDHIAWAAERVTQFLCAA